jgi:hypothetical protein
MIKTNAMATYKKTQQGVGRVIDIVENEALRFSDGMSDTKQAITTEVSDIKDENIKMKKTAFKNRLIITHHNKSWTTYSIF